MSQTRFSSPYEHHAPAGAEGWKELYPYFLVFQDNLKESEEAKFFFCDSQHWPNVFKPFDAMTVEFGRQMFGAVQHAALPHSAREWY